MSGRRIELSVTQVTSSVLATVTGAFVASSLGVTGTVIGVAVVSFATTAGTAVYRHYLARTQERLRSAAAAMGHLATTAPTRTGNGRTARAPTPGETSTQDQAPQTSMARLRGQREASHGTTAGAEAPGAEAPGTGTPGAAAPGAGWSSAEPGGPLHETWIMPAQAIMQAQADAEGAAAPDASASGGGQPGPGSNAAPATSSPGNDGPESGARGTEKLDSAAADGQAPGRQGLAGVLRGLAATRWVRFAAAAVMIFVLAMGGITILEAATGKPLDALIWGAHSSGTTVGNVVDGPAHRSHQPPAKPSNTPTPHATPTHHTPKPTPTPTTPTPSPSTSAPSPTPTPTATPSTTPSPATARTPSQATPSPGSR
jgi:hypothetical protein